MKQYHDQNGFISSTLVMTYTSEGLKPQFFFIRLGFSKSSSILSYLSKFTNDHPDWINKDITTKHFDFLLECCTEK